MRFSGSAARVNTHPGAASASGKGSLRPDGRSGITASAGAGAPAYRAGVTDRPIGSARGASTSSSASGTQRSVVVASPEAVAFAFGADAERLAPPLRRGGGVLERARQPARFPCAGAAVVAGEVGGDERGGDAEHDQHDQQFDQREAGRDPGRETARRRRARQLG